MLCYQVRNYWLSFLSLFFNELVNDCITKFFLSVSSFVLCCLQTLKENSAQKGQMMDTLSAVRSFLRACSYGDVPVRLPGWPGRRDSFHFVFHFISFHSFHLNSLYRVKSTITIDLQAALLKT